MKPWRREHIVTSEKLRKTIFTSLLHRTLEIKTVRNLSYSHRTQENNNNKKIEKGEIEGAYQQKKMEEKLSLTAGQVARVSNRHLRQTWVGAGAYQLIWVLGMSLFSLSISPSSPGSTHPIHPPSQNPYPNSPFLTPPFFSSLPSLLP